MKLRSILLALLGLILSATAQAQPIQGFYVSGGAGFLFPFPIKTTSLEPGVGGRFLIKQDSGFDAQFSVGYALGNGWRFELEGTYGRSSIKGVAGAPFAGAASGSIDNRGIMLNALFDLDIRSPYVFPYVGLGAGYQSTRLNSFVDRRTGGTGEFTASGVAGGLAVQAIGGLSFPIPNMPGLSLTADYRITDILGGEKFNGGSTIGGPAGATPMPGAIKFHNQFDQVVLFGVRYAFNTPPPAPIVTGAATVPQGGHSYEVAFDPDTAVLTDRAQKIVRDAALASTRLGVTRIAVTGPDGGTGDARHGLRGRRANIVLAALVADGVSRDAIGIQGSGSDPDAKGSGPDRRIMIVTE